MNNAAATIQICRYDHFVRIFEFNIELLMNISYIYGAKKFLENQTNVELRMYRFNDIFKRPVTTYQYSLYKRFPLFDAFCFCCKNLVSVTERKEKCVYQDTILNSI